VANITEITEQVATSLEILEGDSTQLEISGEEVKLLEIIEYTTDGGTPDVNIKADIKTIEIPGESPTTINISKDAPSSISISEESIFLDITEKTLISGAFDLNFNNLLNIPYIVSNNNIGVGPGNGSLPTLVDPQFPLHVTGTLFSTTVSSSQVQISGDSVNDLFLVKLEGENKLVINAEGVTVLGQFNITPTAVAGGLFYSASNDFFLGLE
tara:strand:+ start:482 stop:1117 length:636 start_codon:yes stop_codon:yes gene_type:complete